MTDPGTLPEPHGNYRWAVWLGGRLDGSVVGLFTECSGLEIERPVETVAEGGVNDRVHYLPGPVKRGSITLRRGVADATLWEWFSRCMYQGGVERHDVMILLFDTAGKLTSSWPIPDAIPVKWAGPDLKTGSKEIAVEWLTLGQNTSDSAKQGEGRKKVRPKKSAVDPHALARKVYHLLRLQLQVEQERRGGRR